MEMNWREIIASYLESVTLPELCWLVISKRGGIGFLEEEGFHFPFISWGTCWQDLRQHITKWRLQPLPSVCRKGLFLTKICSVTAFAAWPCKKKKKKKKNPLPAKLRLLCVMWEWEGEVQGGNPVGQQCPWRLCHENMPQVNYCPLTSIHAETGALHNNWRRQFLLQKMLCFQLPK